MSSTRPVRFSFAVSRRIRSGRIKRREIVEKNLVARDLGILEIDRFDFDQREVALAVLRRANLAGDGVAGAQVELPDLRWRDVDIVRTGQIVVLRRAEKAEAVRQAFQNALGENQAVLFRLRAEDLEDQLLLAHAGGAGDVQLLGDLRQIGNVLVFQFCKANTHRFLSFSSLDTQARLLGEINPGRARSFEALYPRFQNGLCTENLTLRSRTEPAEQDVGGPKDLIGQFIVLRDVRAELGFHSVNRRLCRKSAAVVSSASCRTSSIDSTKWIDICA